MKDRIQSMMWYAHRARAMSPPEVVYRLRLRLRSERHRRRAGTWSTLPDVVDPRLIAKSHESEHTLDVVCALDRLWSHEAYGDVASWWRAEFPQVVSETLADADEIRGGRLRLFGRIADVGRVPDWHRHPFQNQTWPLRYWTEVPHRGGGAKYVWEVNRHQYLPVLVRASMFSGDLSYAALAYEHILDWIDKNPRLLGINWTSGIELALRIISWGWTLAQGTHLGIVSAAMLDKILPAVHAQAEHLYENLSRYSSANNHLIAEAVGLIAAGTMFPLLRRAAAWRSTGTRVLGEEVPRQILPDGVGAEQAFHYLAFVSDLVLQSVILLERSGEAVPPQVDDRLRTAGLFLATVADAAGHVPQIGDSDDGVALPIDRQDASPYAATAARLAARYKIPGVAKLAFGAEDSAVWLFGPAALVELRRLCEVDILHPLRRTFPVGGYTALRTGTGHDERLVLFDHGPLGYLSQAAHGHADALSVCYSQGGQPLIVDTGTYTYHESRRWRDYFRGTLAHNTVTVAHESQSRPLGPTIWGRRARVSEVRSGDHKGINWVSAVHDGYVKRHRVLHRRIVLCLTDGDVIIVDELFGKHAHPIELTWHLHPDVAFQQDATDQSVWIERGRQQLRLRFSLPPGMEYTAQRGASEDSLPCGWFSDRYGLKVPTWTVVARGVPSLPCSILTLFATGSSKRTVVETSATNGGIRRRELRVLTEKEPIRHTIALRNGQVLAAEEHDLPLSALGSV